MNLFLCSNCGLPAGCLWFKSEEVRQRSPAKISLSLSEVEVKDIDRTDSPRSFQEDTIQDRMPLTPQVSAVD